MYIRADVGATSQFSEIAMVQTLDNLRANGTLDVIQYLERIPDKLIPKRAELIEELKTRMGMQAEQLAMQGQSAQNGAAAGAAAAAQMLMTEGGSTVGGPLNEKNAVAAISARTLDKYREYIARFFSWANSEGYISKDPAKSIPAIKHEVTPRVALSQVELEYLRSACETPRETAIVEMLYSTGCRVSELAGLKKSDINWHDKSVHLYGKGRKHRTSFLNAKAYVALVRYLDSRNDSSDFLFVSSRRPYGALKKEGIEKIVRTISSRPSCKTDKAITPHVLRHMTATTALQSGMPIEDISKLLGHAKIDTTMIYAKTSLENVRSEHKKHII